MNIQFNTKAFKDTRIKLAKYHDAQHSLNDFICKRSDTVKGLKAVIATDKSDLDKIESGDTTGILRDADTIRAEIADFENKLALATEELHKATAACNERCESAESVIDKSLYEEYCRYIGNLNDAECVSAYANAIADMFRACGLVSATADNCTRFVGVVGVARNSAKSAYKTGMLVKPVAFKTWRKLFLCNLCDTLVSDGVIAPHKYAYKPISNK